MFPTGSAGVALLILRVSAAATLIHDTGAHTVPLTTFWCAAGLAIPAILLCLGLFTPYCSVGSGLIQLWLLMWRGKGLEFYALTSIVNSGVLAVLGPGAYSVDARIFGRRLLTLPPRRE